MLGSLLSLASRMSGDPTNPVPLRVDAVAKRFGAVTAVDGVSFEIAAGACFGLKTLSGGMKRRLNMAAGMLHRPKVVLFDEPTVGVDPQSRNRIFEMIEALRDAGTAIVYTTHYMEEAERLCDRIAIIDHGRIIAEGTKEELVAQSFGSRSSVTMHVGATRVDLAAWAAARGGTAQDSVVLCSVEKPAEIAGLLEAASGDGLDVLDVTLQRPNLESVFLHLTGKEEPGARAAA
jgi:ABC-2 type transport system ATP-binding protein